MLRAVLFDLDGTLIKTVDASEILRRILSIHGIEKSISEIMEARIAAEESLTIEDYKMPYYDFWDSWNMKILRRLGVKGDLSKLSRRITDLWWEYADVKLYPDVTEAIKILRGMNLKLGIITNGFQKDIEIILSKLRFRHSLDITVGVDSVKKPKPHKEIFLYAVNRLKIEPEEALYIGDAIEADYFGALRAGLKALLIDREDRVQRRDIEKIRSLLEISKYIT